MRGLKMKLRQKIGAISISDEILRKMEWRRKSKRETAEYKKKTRQKKSYQE